MAIKNILLPIFAEKEKFRLIFGLKISSQINK